MQQKTCSKKIIELLPWLDFLPVHLKKDPGLFPEYLSKTYDTPFEIVCISSADKKIHREQIAPKGTLVKLPRFTKKQHNKLTDPCRFLFLFPLIKYIWKNRKSSTNYILFHATDNTLTLVFFIKLFSPASKIWLKLDATPTSLNDLCKQIETKNSLKKKILSARYRYLYSKINLITAETSDTYSILKNSSFFSKRNIDLIPNGLDFLPDLNKLKKENIILSVARFGSFQKNTELFLSAVSKIDLSDWSVYCIGPIENEFNPYIESFYEKNPLLKDKIHFLGNISDKRKLYEYYERSKIFVLTSRFESFGIATLEAMACGDYIISTEVGAARDLISDEKFGYILPESKQNNQDEKKIEENLIKKLTMMINNPEQIDLNLEERRAYTKGYLMENIINKDCFKNWL